MPGASDSVAGLEQGEVVKPGLVEEDRGADPREPGPDDRGVVIGRDEGAYAAEPAVAGSEARAATSSAISLMIRLSSKSFGV